jgi:peptide/nickel transport system permease protein
MAESQTEQTSTVQPSAAVTPSLSALMKLQTSVRGWLNTTWKFIKLKPLGAVGAFLILIIVAMAAFPGLFDTHDPMRIVTTKYLGADGTYFFGTDSVGRDQYSRVIHGARTTVQISVTGVLIAVTAALLIATISAYYGGLFDLLLQRVIDTILAIPGLVLALFILTIFPPSKTTLIGTMVVLFIPRSVRTIRASVLSIKEMPYVDSARAIGASTPRILLKYIFPQITSLYLILISLIIGNAIIIESSLAFLGLGLGIDTPSWGNLVNRGIQNIFFSTWTLAIPPGIAIAMAVFGFNLFGDALRDVLDPRLRGSGAGLKRGGGGATSSG